MFHTVGFQGDHEHAVTLICLVLKQLDFQWSYTKDKKLKCRIDFEKENLMDDEQFIQYYINRKFLKFNISIYKEPPQARSLNTVTHATDSSTQYGSSSHSMEKQRSPSCVNPKQTNFLIDLQLTRGTPLVFTDFAHNFFNMLRQILKNEILISVHSLEPNNMSWLGAKKNDKNNDEHGRDL